MKYSINEFFKIPMQYSRREAIEIIILKLLSGTLPTVQVLQIAELVDQISLFVAHEQSMTKVVLAVSQLALTMLYLRLSEQIQAMLETKLKCNIRLNYRTKIFCKCAKLKYSFIEDKSTQDLIARVSKDIEGELTRGFILILNLLSVIMRLLGIAVIVICEEWWCGLGILFLSIPVIYLSKKNGEEIYQANKDAAFYERRTEYFNGLLIGRESMDERTVFGFQKYIKAQWKDNYNTSYKMQIQAFLSYFLKTQCYCILAVVISLVMVVLLLESFMKGKLTIGLFTAIVSNLVTVMVSLVQQLSYIIREISKEKEYIRDIAVLFQMEEEEGALEKPEDRCEKVYTIEFCKVSFRYPGTKRYILKDVSFLMESSKHYAFVGENGAGKTTIVKLLTGLYRDYEGEIKINGKELREYTLPQLKALFSVVYQDFAQYSISLNDNIAIGDINHFDTNDTKQKEAMCVLGIDKICHYLPKGAQTELGKLGQNAEELSMGQWQKIAIARAMVRNAPICILDEPTASLDPLLENEIYKEYQKICGMATSIFISHRLGAVKLSDIIFVFDNGQLIEEGTFQELMDAEGKFKIMYETQRSWYE